VTRSETILSHLTRAIGFIEAGNKQRAIEEIRDAKAAVAEMEREPRTFEG
jgi:hypothetical protein